MQDNRIETDTVEEAQGVGKLVNLVEDGTANLDNSKFSGVGRIRGGREDAEVAFDLTLRADRVQEAGDSVLRTEISRQS